MCTLTWTHRPNGGGYRLLFNRDELRTRGPEIPPRIEERAGVRYIAPADSDAGGTWIAVNEYGVTVALLNGYIESRGPDRDHWTSRGELVRSLADLPDTRSAWRRLAPREFGRYRPAVVAVVAAHGPSLLARWDGLTLSIDGTAERQLPITSSSYEQDDVQRARRAAYREIVGETGRTPAPPSFERLLAFQRHVTPEGPTAFTPSMSRPDAATRSQCLVDVAGDHVDVHYTPGPPHETESLPALTIARAQP